MVQHSLCDNILISIHALREEGDHSGCYADDRRQRISIHALREEGDLGNVQHRKRRTNFYPRPPRGGRHYQREHIKRTKPISIHALREEGDIRCTMS